MPIRASRAGTTIIGDLDLRETTVKMGCRRRL
jgi:hypothetical protein